MTDKTALIFNTEDIELLARTADALSAYLGKPVLVEVISASETGFEWAVFAIPLDVNEDNSDIPVVQIGGANALLLGSQGGVKIAENEIYSCRFMWAIQRTDADDVKYVKINHEGDENAWGETLKEVLPFDMSGDPMADDEDDDETTDISFIQPPSDQQH